jgi:hypothetical protein
MPKTIGQTWTEISNYAVNAFRPVIDRVQEFINSPVFDKIKSKVFGIIDKIANGVIRLFDLFETPRIQNAVSSICTALSTLWDIALQVGTFMVNVAIWISDNWSWIAPVVYTVVTALLIYNTITFISAILTFLFGSAATAGSLASYLLAAGLIAVGSGGAIVVTTLGWVVLIIIAIIAVIYLAVAAWNHFTGQTVSATGIIFGAIAFVIACIADLFIFIGDVFGTIVEIIKFVGENIWNTFVWLLDFLKIWGSNVIDGMSQICEQLPLYWERFKASVVMKFWSLVYGAGLAFNVLLKGASDIARKMVTPFENFANKVVDLLNSIISGWNNVTKKLTLTLPEMKIFGQTLWKEKTIHLVGSEVDELDPVSWNDWADPSGINLSGVASNFGNALSDYNAANSAIKPIDWNTTALPQYSDYVDWAGTWEQLKNNLDKTWSKEDYKNPVEAFKKWYEKGAALEEGISGLVDGIGELLSDLLGGGGSTNSLLGDFSQGLGGNSNVPSSLEDLLGGYDGGTSDPLGTIADNTGKSAGSASNIEDTLDLAEEELELLRSIAEKEVINRFTTAEIKVNMTNNNTIKSGMDLDGIVTHLSNKLYEELGVVASGVHY